MQYGRISLLLQPSDFSRFGKIDSNTS
jgi:hypothetical protein